MVFPKGEEMKIAFTILCVFAFMGSIFAGTILHEYSHYYDYRNVRDKLSDQVICTYYQPLEFKWDEILYSYGSYSFKVNSSDTETIKEIERIDKYTEWKAYFISTIVVIIFTVVMFMVLFKLERESFK